MLRQDFVSVFQRLIFNVSLCGFIRLSGTVSRSQPSSQPSCLLLLTFFFALCGLSFFVPQCKQPHATTTAAKAAANRSSNSAKNNNKEREVYCYNSSE